jgi:DNA polymerase
MPAEDELRQLAATIQACTDCQLSQARKLAVPGEGPSDAAVMFIGEGPGFHENEQGRPFVGAAGRFLEELLAGIGLTRQQVFICNVVKCRPPGNRDPQPDEIDACHPYLEGQLELIDPKVVVALGNFSAKLLLGTTVGITKLRGQVYPFAGRLLVPTYHPAAILRGGGDKLAEMRADLVRAKQALLAPPQPQPTGPARPDAGAEPASLFEP